MFLEILIGHIDSLIRQTVNLENAEEIDQIPFSRIKNLLRSSIKNYRNGLLITKQGLKESIIKRAELYAKRKTKDGKSLSVEQILYTIYQQFVSTSYVTAERFHTETTMLVKAGIPPEIYHWLLEIPEHFGIKKIIIFQEGPRFLTETFDQKIVKPLKTMIELAKKSEVQGSLAQLKPIDLLKLNPIEGGYVISCVRGEAKNPVLWPILCHEMFELVDKEQNLLKSFEQFAFTKGVDIPTLDPTPKVNQHWVSEILMDLLAINSFGPMYAKSLLNYFKRSPYYQTFEHPEMSSRLFCVYQYLKAPIEDKTDISSRCQMKAIKEVEQEIKRYRMEGELDSIKEDKLSTLYSLVSQFSETIDAPSFSQRLNAYFRQAGNSKITLSEILKKKETIDFIPFQDCLLEFKDIRNNILHHHISLAIDPNIMLNVVLANYDEYQKNEPLGVVVDSIKKWKTKWVWNHSVSILEESS